jgi:dTDP-glucose pyrophosphorylase/predicted transcriptional regulator
MKDIQNIKLSKNASIEEALKVIGDGAMQIALVVDKSDKLIGTLTDGDIRRGLLKGLDLNSSIQSITFKTPTIAKESDTKETILKLAISKKLQHIPVIDESGKVVGIQEISQLVMPNEKKNKVILMVGGLGERLGSLTKDTPKPMLKVGNKSILETIVENFKGNGYTNIVMCLNYKSEIIQDYFGDGSEFGVNIEYILEQKRMGTAGALSLLKDNSKEPFFVMNGDLLTNVNFEKIHEFYLSNNAQALMCVREYESQVPYGVINIENTKIVSVEEKPTQKFFVNAGIYMLNPEVLKYIPKNEFYNMTTLFEKLIDKDKNIISFPIDGYWLDIGRFEEYKKANEEYNEVF